MSDDGGGLPTVARADCRRAKAGRRPKVCFVIPSLSGGGAERVAVQVLNALDDDRWQRSLFLFERSGPYLADVSPSIQVEATAAPSRVGRWRALRRFVRRERPEVVVAFLSYLSVLTAVRAAAAGARVVFDVGTPVSAFLADADYTWSRRWLRQLFAAAMRVGCAATDRIVATSQGVADDLVARYGARAARVSVVPNPVDFARIGAAAQEPLDAPTAARWQPPVVVAAGRLAGVKNYPLLIEAFAALRRQIPASLFILGDGAEEADIRRLVHAFGLDACTCLCGFQANPWKYIARADVFALTSRYEGFGNVVVEAMACGVPVVATASPGTREIVSPGADGFLVEPHEPSAFARALADILSDAALRRRMAAAARTKAERFRTHAVASAYERVFSEALA